MKKTAKLPLEIVLYVDHFIYDDYNSMNWLLACGLSMERIYDYWEEKSWKWGIENSRTANYLERVFYEPEIYEFPSHYACKSDQTAITSRPIPAAAVQIISLAAAVRTQLSMLEYVYEGLAFADRALPNMHQHRLRAKMMETAKLMRFTQDRLGEVLIGYADDDDD